MSKGAYDWGDLPNSYGTERQDDPTGPRHRVKNGGELYLGALVDTESDGVPSVEADGDVGDEDGVSTIGVWQDGTNSAQVQVTVGLGAGWLVGYIDFNNDGDLSDAGEVIISEEVSDAGSGIYTNVFTVPSGAISSTNLTALYARFRLFPDEVIFPQFAFSGAADDGEVEDYRFRFGAVGDYVWKDADGDDVRRPPGRWMCR